LGRAGCFPPRAGNVRRMTCSGARATADRSAGSSGWSMAGRSAYLAEEFHWPGLRLCGRIRRSRRAIGATRWEEQETHTWVSSLSPEGVTAKEIARMLRGHWTVENSITRCQLRRGSSPRAQDRSGPVLTAQRGHQHHTPGRLPLHTGWLARHRQQTRSRSQSAPTHEVDSLISPEWNRSLLDPASGSLYDVNRVA